MRKGRATHRDSVLKEKKKLSDVQQFVDQTEHIRQKKKRTPDLSTFILSSSENFQGRRAS